MLNRLGKDDFLAALRAKGFNNDEALRAFDAVSSFLKKAIEDGNTVYIRGVLKLEARMLPPRIYRDNLNKKDVCFGERVSHLFRKLGN
jgi:nucleoid DNA-binding protein